MLVVTREDMKWWSDAKLMLTWCFNNEEEMCSISKYLLFIAFNENNKTTIYVAP